MNTGMRIGIDFGRVIQGVDGEGADTPFLNLSPLEALEAPSVPYALLSIREICLEAQDVWIISKCGALTQAKTLAWLYANEFWQFTGVKSSHIRFCEKREGKAPIAQELGLTHFIDDRVGVLAPMQGIVENLILFGPQRNQAPDFVTECLTWPEVLTHLHV